MHPSQTPGHRVDAVQQAGLPAHALDEHQTTALSGARGRPGPGGEGRRRSIPDRRSRRPCGGLQGCVASRPPRSEASGVGAIPARRRLLRRPGASHREASTSCGPGLLRQAHEGPGQLRANSQASGFERQSGRGRSWAPAGRPSRRARRSTGMQSWPLLRPAAEPTGSRGR